MTIRNAVLVHNGLATVVEKTGAAYRRHAQPEYPYSFDLADRVTFALSVLGVQGSADGWYLKTRFQIGNPNSTHWQFTAPAWTDLQPEQKKTLIVEGADWYAGAQPAQLTNLAPRPSEAFTDWNAVPGTGGTAAATTQTSGGYSGPNFRRVTWSAATTSVSGGVQLEASAAITPTVGKAYSAAIAARSSVGQRVQFGIDWMNASNGVVSSSFASGVVLTAGQWTRLTVLNSTAPADAATGRLVVKASAGASGVNWSPGDTLDADAALAVEGATLPPVPVYWDGSTPDAAWAGSVNASPSVWTPPGIIARNGDILPVTALRTIRDFGSLARVIIQPVAVNPSNDFAVRYSLTAVY